MAVLCGLLSGSAVSSVDKYMWLFCVCAVLPVTVALRYNLKSGIFYFQQWFVCLFFVVLFGWFCFSCLDSL